MNPLLLILFLILLGLALPVALRRKSWGWFFAAMILSFVIVVLPLFVFFLSGFMEPEWKGACRHGWVDCFIVGKLALAPLVLFATAALYSLEVVRVEKPVARGIVIGVFLGAVIATVCLVFGLVCIGWQPWMLVPFYVAVWYSIRAVQLIGTAGLSFWNYFIALIGSLPFWVASCWWSQKAYQDLPNQAPSGCFIVTAATRGHPKMVGPLVPIQHHGREQAANRQLITFWELESRWRHHAPRSHSSFRKIYNRVGPVIAARILSPWLADAAWLALKPLEITARLINHHASQNHEPRQMD